MTNTRNILFKQSDLNIWRRGTDGLKREFEAHMTNIAAFWQCNFKDVFVPRCPKMKVFHVQHQLQLTIN